MTPPARLHRVGFSEKLHEFNEWRWQRGEGRWDDPRIFEIRQRLAAAFGAFARVDADQIDEAVIDGAFASEIARTTDKLPYRVLYLATSRRSAFVEVLQNFRHSKKPLAERLRAKLKRIEQDDAEIPVEETSGPGTGIVPRSHFDDLYVGEVGIEDCRFIDLEHVDSIRYVDRDPLEEIARAENLGNVNLGAILSSVRNFTRALSSWLFHDVLAPAGVRLGSTFGRPHENWSVFERRAGYGYQATLQPGSSGRVDLDDPQLHHALRDLGIRLG